MKAITIYISFIFPKISVFTVNSMLKHDVIKEIIRNKIKIKFNACNSRKRTLNLSSC